ncbi:MAG: hypothetical protein FD152_977 [Xanthobacteraceae bacterium]|nr:MAG: hypothetical protein FD152_977 [Xanthobacteraceae bacterium]
MAIDAELPLSRTRRERGPMTFAAQALLLGAILCFRTPLSAHADAPPPARRDFRGQWAGSGSPCRSPDEFLLVYDRRTVWLPFRGSNEPARECRIVSASGRFPEWRLRLSCQHPDPTYRLPGRFTVHQTLRMSANRFEMTVRTEPVLGQPARIDETRYCRGPDDGPPPLRCIDPVSLTTIPCEP